MIFPKLVKDTVVDCVRWADKLIRSELIANVIVSENDYTSNFTGALRREINSRNIPNLNAQSLVLPAIQERKYGADAAIILGNKNEFKIGLFEAKWPRLKTHSNYWDSIQKSTGRSHFHEQMFKQTYVRMQFAIWKMFYCEYDFGTQTQYFPNYGSACVWHEKAYQFSENRTSHKNPWTDSELLQLLQANKLEIGHIISEICECRKGVALKGTDYQRALYDYGHPKEIVLIQYSGDVGLDGN